ncbi:hypothetical protein [Streptomyces chrestomyceticus]|uniref:Uncharacterized protein n=1 Tax=Streptomyces chrestomyceticus TaxID=68185 RepID=A0ABU7X347_9ACTN
MIAVRETDGAAASLRAAKVNELRGMYVYQSKAVAKGMPHGSKGLPGMSVTRGVPVLVIGDNFACRTKRPNEETGGFESGVFLGHSSSVIALGHCDHSMSKAGGGAPGH